MIHHLDRPELPGDVVASFVGDGAPMLVRRALGDPDDQALLDRGLQYFLEYYRDHKLDYTLVRRGERNPGRYPPVAKWSSPAYGRVYQQAGKSLTRDRGRFGHRRFLYERLWW